MKEQEVIPDRMLKNANPGNPVPQARAYDVYLMPGLGLDERIFGNIALQNGHLYRMHWLEPYPDEKLPTYVSRLSAQIKETGRPRVFVGHSFGGIIVQELQKVVKADKLVLISTITSPKELPFKLRLLKYTQLHVLIRTFLLTRTLKRWGPRHGYDTEKLRDIFRTSAGRLSSRYFRWAIDQVVRWQAATPDCPVLRIHGTRDRTFPLKPDGKTLTLADGDHLLVYKHGPVISQQIDDFLTGS